MRSICCKIFPTCWHHSWHLLEDAAWQRVAICIAVASALRVQNKGSSFGFSQEGFIVASGNLLLDDPQHAGSQKTRY